MCRRVSWLLALAMVLVGCGSDAEYWDLGPPVVLVTSTTSTEPSVSIATSAPTTSTLPSLTTTTTTIPASLTIPGSLTACIEIAYTNRTSDGPGPDLLIRENEQWRPVPASQKDRLIKDAFADRLIKALGGYISIEVVDYWPCEAMFTVSAAGSVNSARYGEDLTCWFETLEIEVAIEMAEYDNRPPQLSAGFSQDPPFQLPRAWCQKVPGFGPAAFENVFLRAFSPDPLAVLVEYIRTYCEAPDRCPMAIPEGDTTTTTEPSS